MVRIGTAADVAWIASGTDDEPGHPISVAIPPVFDAYATFYPPDEAGVGVQQHEAAVVHELVARTPEQPWWLGFLQTGAHDIVVDDAPRVSLYFDWPYVIVEGGPEQALNSRTGHMRASDGVLPDLFFPADRSWLVSALWDDTWTCIGGSADLVDAFQRNPLIQARRVQLGDDATPPGHAAY